MIEVAGLVVSVVVWAAAAAAYMRLARARRATLPPGWSDRLELSEADLGRRFVRFRPPLAPWFAGLAVYSALLNALDVLFALQLAAAAALAVWWARVTLAHYAYEFATIAERDGLELPERPARERLAYAATVYLMALGIVLAVCFTGRLLWRLVA